jgi:hypothetical protein
MHVVLFSLCMTPRFTWLSTGTYVQQAVNKGSISFTTLAGCCGAERVNIVGRAMGEGRDVCSIDTFALECRCCLLAASAIEDTAGGMREFTGISQESYSSLAPCSTFLPGCCCAMLCQRQACC